MAKPSIPFSLVVAVPIGVVLLVVVGGIVWIPGVVFADRVLPGVNLLGINLGRADSTTAANLVTDLSQQANLSPITLEFNEQLWQLNPAEFKLQVEPTRLAAAALTVGRRGGLGQRLIENWLGLFGVNQSLAIQDESLYSFDRSILTTQLAAIAETVVQPRRDAKLTIKNNRVTEFIAPQNGQELDIDQAVDLVAGSIFGTSRQLSLPVKVVAPNVTLAETNSLGINTLLARGESDFSGSPKNRRHNIGVGAGRFDGLIVPAGETFSFLKNLGEVDGTTGYLPELVIKGDKTIPEFGGGLCQVSTTAFRGILRAGLPITARQNHSYRVAYYEPAGTDATIYQPYPDLKFVNDTGGALLIDTLIVGNKLFFDFYGTDTGRKVELDGPHIFNVTAYPEPIYIDTTTLPVGETKQVDSAHRGADAVLYRKVVQHGKVVINDTFKSHYIPWPAKFLRGAEDASTVEVIPDNLTPVVPANQTPAV